MPCYDETKDIEAEADEKKKQAISSMYDVEMIKNRLIKKTCEFCEKKPIASGMFFAGDYGPPHGPFSFCEECLKKHVDYNGFPLRHDEIFDKEAYDRAIWE